MMMCSLCTTSTSELTFINDHFNAFCASWLAQAVHTTQSCKSSKACAPTFSPPTTESSW